MVRAKFRVSRVERHATYDGGEAHTVHMDPVLQNSDENKKFWSATPGGKLEMYLLNPEAAKQLELGKEYYIDFTPAK